MKGKIFGPRSYDPWPTDSEGRKSKQRSRKPGVPGVRINKSSIETAGVAGLHTATPNRLRRQVLDAIDNLEYGSGTLLGRYGGERI